MPKKLHEQTQMSWIQVARHSNARTGVRMQIEMTDGNMLQSFIVECSERLQTKKRKRPYLGAFGVFRRKVIGTRDERLNHAEVDSHVPNALDTNGAGVIVVAVLGKAVGVHEMAARKFLQVCTDGHECWPPDLCCCGVAGQQSVILWCTSTDDILD